MNQSTQSPTTPQCGCHTAARVIADHHEQNWVLLEDGTIVFDDGGEILPNGTIVPAHRAEPAHRMAVAS